jgi:hypothetical protein
LIVQAGKPFLAVHVNAAFSRLTGMQNSGIIGRPLSKIFALIDYNKWESTSKEDKIPNENAQDESGGDSGEARGDCTEETQDKQITISQLMGESNFGTFYKVTTIVEKSDGNSSNNSNSANELSNNSSISTKEDSFTSTKCMMSICAIVSTQPRRRSSSMGPPNQKQKTNNNNVSSSKSPNKSIGDKNITHCLIQLTPCDDGSGSLCIDNDSNGDNYSSPTSSHAAKACG